MLFCACNPTPSQSTKQGHSSFGAEFVSELEKQSQRSPTVVASTEPSNAIKRFCGDCHALPKPDRFERAAWHDRIRAGYEYYAKSARSDLEPPPLESVLQYYLHNAPNEMRFPTPPAVDQDWVDRFSISKLDWKEGGYVSPAITSITWVELMEPGQSQLIVTDMRDGSVSLVSPNSRSRKLLCRLKNPARVTVCDFDRDGQQDFIVSDLGSMKPFDHPFGKVVLFRRLPSSTNFEPIVLLKDVGRVSDVVVHDFGGDEKMDLVVAEFGSRARGSVRLLINESESLNEPRFSTRFLDTRPGALELALWDWNRDGSLDLTTMISQEYETIELFIHDRHQNGFQQHTIYVAPDPLVGSSGIELVDLDQDGDQDIVYTNGDSFDNNWANPSHGVGWLENQGGFRFEHHRIIQIPGAFQATASDMDKDGDLDIVVTTFLPATILPESLRESEPVAIMILEQTEPLTFVPHVLEKGTARYPALEVADFNQDGKMDFAVGALLINGEKPGSRAIGLPRLTVWFGK